MEQLSENQLRAFDTEYVNDRRWIPVKRCIDRDFPEGEFTFLDAGGGNGVFADRILANYGRAKGVVLDNSRLLLGRNKPDTRKRLVFDSVENLERFTSEKFDLVFFNWLLHHLVARASYSRSRENIDHALHTAGTILTQRGRVSIYENLYDGLVFDGLPSWFVYRLTSAKALAKLVEKAGANSAGVGVCFLSYRQWCSNIERIGFHILDYAGDDLWVIPWTWRAFLHIRGIRCGHFWLRSHESGAPSQPRWPQTAAR